MNHATVPIETTSRNSSRPTVPQIKDVPTGQAPTVLEVAEWRVVRKGLGLMAGSLTILLIAVLGTFLTERCRAESEPVGLLLRVPFVASLLITAAGYFAGVVLSLSVPRRSLPVGFLLCLLFVAGILITAAMYFAEVVPRVFWDRSARRAWWVTIFVALHFAGLAYCLYLAGIARQFAARRLSAGFVAFFVVLVFLWALIALTEIAAVFWQQRWLPPFESTWNLGHFTRWKWKADLFDFASGMLFILGVIWTAFLWRLQQCLPREEIG